MISRLFAPFIRYADFQGRSSRAEFWTFFGVSVAVFILTIAATGLSGEPSKIAETNTPEPTASPVGLISYMLWWMATIVPWVAVQVRRFHDQGRSGWLCLIGVGGYVAIGFGILPLAGICFLASMALMALPGKKAKSNFEMLGFANDDVKSNSFHSVASPSIAKFSGTKLAATYPKDGAVSFASNQECPKTKPELSQSTSVVAADANVRGGQEGENKKPISNCAARTEQVTSASKQTNLPDNISRTDNGQYSCRGYLFNSLEAAVSFARRKSAPAHHISNAMAPELHENILSRGKRVQPRSKKDTAINELKLTSKPNVTQPLSDKIETGLLDTPHDVFLLVDGRYSCRGYIFNSLGAAVSFSKRQSTLLSSESVSPADIRNPAPFSGESVHTNVHDIAQQKIVAPQSRPNSIENATTGPMPRSELGSKIPCAGSSLNDAMPSYLPADVKPEGAGRFSCGGHMFNSLELALNFAKRRNDGIENAMRSGSPFSYVPAPEPQQPAQLEEKFGIFSGGSSAKKRTVAEYWVATPTNLSADDVAFLAHLVYFGTRRSDDQYERHRSLIDPNLEVSNGRDPEGSTFSYWPNYSELRPEARRTYLEWLSAGRCNPNIPIGYVFIYFYGLERRLVKDRSQSDAPAIMKELSRLLAIYGNNHSFKNYCSALLEMGELLFEDVGESPIPTLDNRYSWEIPIRLRVYLGRKVAAGQRLNSNDCLCWTLSHPTLSTRTSVTRCFSEFCNLWKIRFDEHFRTGLLVRQPKTRLTFLYRSASSEFNSTAAIDDLPDIGAISGPISKFEFLLNSCSDELDPLSRFLGRNPLERDSAIANALLPEMLHDKSDGSELDRFSEFLGSASLHRGFAEIGMSDIMTFLGFAGTGNQEEKRALYLKWLPEVIDAAGFGFEPDKRYGPSQNLSDGTKLCLFRAERGGAVVAGRPEYVAARTMVEIAALAALADDLVVDAEVASITTDLDTFPDITDLERLRLRAHAMALLGNPSKLKAATKRLYELPELQREAALASAVRAVLADQRITPSEVRFLEGLYKALGLPQDEVYSRLHNGEQKSGSSRKISKPLVLRSQPDAVGTEIDYEKLARLKQETSAVCSMLSSIFKDDGSGEDSVADKVVIQAEIEGLDKAHCSLLVRLMEGPLDKDAFETICRHHKLLPSGAIETINDWAFDALDDYAIDEGELIYIQEHLIDPIKVMRKAI